MALRNYEIHRKIEGELEIELDLMISKKLNGIKFENATIRYNKHSSINFIDKLQLHFTNRDVVQFIEIITNVEETALGEIGDFKVRVAQKPHLKKFKTWDNRITYFEEMGILSTGLSLINFNFKLKEILLYGYEKNGDIEEIPFVNEIRHYLGEATHYDIKTLEQIFFVSETGDVIRVNWSLPKGNGEVTISTIQEEMTRLTKINHPVFGKQKLRYHIK